MAELARILFLWSVVALAGARIGRAVLHGLPPRMGHLRLIFGLAACVWLNLWVVLVLALAEYHRGQ